MNRPSVSEIEEEATKAMELRAEEMNTGIPKWGGMTYVEGVVAALDWVTGQTDDKPIDDD